MRGAAETASLVRTGRIAARTVIDEALASAIESQDRLNAYTLIDAEGARARAAAIDRIVADGGDPGPLAGVPIGLKDLIDQAGLPNTKGASFPASIPEHSSTVVDRLESAGAVVIGRTGLHEFAFGFTSENPWFGPVRNPWDPATSPGGSSGGSAATVAAGTVPIAIGTDTGGSVRVPAAMCGIFGLKVSHGRVPLKGVYPLAESYDTVGPLARSTEDLTAAYFAIAGDDPGDPWSEPVAIAPIPSTSQNPIRIGVVRQWFEAPLAEGIRSDIDLFIESASSDRIEFIEVDDERLRPTGAVTMAARAEILMVHGERFAHHRESYGPDVQTRLDESLAATRDDVVTARRWAHAARAQVVRLHSQGINALLAPTVGVRSKRIGDDDVEIDGTRVFHRIPLSSFTAPINAIGLPSVALPLVASTGLPPTSIQLIGGPYCEAELLGISAVLETRGLVGFTPPPGI